MQTADTLIQNVQLATMDPAQTEPYGAVKEASIALKDGQIIWAGPQSEAPEFDARHVVDGQQGWLTPGLIDCHTHLVYGGNRAQEFEARLRGESYESISKRGGGIASTVKATRASSEAELLQSALPRLDALLAEGVTTVEIKSGYGLNLEHERKMLRVAGQLSEERDVHVQRTFLGAHALPPEFAGQADAYIDHLIEHVLPAIAQENLADAVDVFCEDIGFSPDQCRKIFLAAQAHSLPVKGHVEQLSDLKGTQLIAEFSGLSADHIEYLAEDDVSTMAKTGLVAVLLPGAFYCLNETQKPPISALRREQVPMAVATDLNPGTSPIASLLLALNQSCVLFGLNPEEALCGATQNAAKALGLHQSKGQIRSGFDGDLVLWDIQHPSELSYGINMNKPKAVWQNGKLRGKADV